MVLQVSWITGSYIASAKRHSFHLADVTCLDQLAAVALKICLETAQWYRRLSSQEWGENPNPDNQGPDGE